MPVTLTVAPALPPLSCVLKLLTGRSRPPAPPGPAVASASAPALIVGAATAGAELEITVGPGSGVIPPELVLAAAIPPNPIPAPIPAEPASAREPKTSAEPTMRTSCFKPRHLSNHRPSCPSSNDVKDLVTRTTSSSPDGLDVELIFQSTDQRTITPELFIRPRQRAYLNNDEEFPRNDSIHETVADRHTNGPSYRALSVGMTVKGTAL